MHFQGFTKLNSGGENDSQPIELPNKLQCQFCGDILGHVGARKVHEEWCKEKPECSTLDEKSTNLLVSSVEESVVSPIVNALISRVCLSVSSEKGGWKLADIFTKLNSSGKKLLVNSQATKNGAIQGNFTESIENPPVDCQAAKNGAVPGNFMQSTENAQDESLDTKNEAVAGNFTESIRNPMPETSKKQAKRQVENDFSEVKTPPKKKNRNSYTYLKKAEILDQYFFELSNDKNLSLGIFGKSVGISKSMLFRWIEDKKNIFENAADEKVCYLKKGRGSDRHKDTFPILYKQFLEARKNGKKVYFLWFWIKGKKIAEEISAPMFTKSAVQVFIKRYNLKVRRVQRKKQIAKNCYYKLLQQWHLKLRESVIKSNSTDENFDKKWGRFKPHQRTNVDQVPLPFALDKKTTYEKPMNRDEKVWISLPGAGLEKRQCTLQLSFSPEDDLKVEIIFRGGGKRIKDCEKKAYHKSVDVYWQKNAWADTTMSCEWVNKTLKSAVPQGEEFLLICDNLKSQVSDEFLQAVRGINGIIHFVVPGTVYINNSSSFFYGEHWSKGIFQFNFMESTKKARHYCRSVV